MVSAPSMERWTSRPNPHASSASRRQLHSPGKAKAEPTATLIDEPGNGLRIPVRSRAIRPGALVAACAI
jgi:hypothetical protein